MKDKLISIIIPVYNVEKYLSKCIESIVNQTYKNLEIILVDDGSTDKSAEICNKWKKIDRRILIFHKQNEGVSSARNLGIHHAKGEYIIFVDSDDYVNENYVENLVNYMPEYDMVSCGYYEVYQNTKIERKNYINNTCISIDEANNQIFRFDGYKGFVWNKIFKKKIIKDHNIVFDTNIHMCEDQLFVADYLKYCSDVLSICDCLYNYRIRKSSVVSGSNKAKLLTIFDAYKKIKSIYENNNRECIYFLYSLIWFYYELRKYIEHTIYKDLDLKKSKKIVFKSNKVNVREKTKLFIKIYLPFIYKIKNKYKNSNLDKFD